jgi:hypothetical protein
MRLGPIELLVVEVSKPDESQYSSKAVSDDIKIMEAMKDMLNAMLLGKLNGITAEEMERVYTIGVQVIGLDVIINVMNLAHDQVYRLQKVYKFSVPSTNDNFPYIKPAVSGFLRLKVREHVLFFTICF